MLKFSKQYFFTCQFLDSRSSGTNSKSLATSTAASLYIWLLSVIVLHFTDLSL